MRSLITGLWMLVFSIASVQLSHAQEQVVAPVAVPSASPAIISEPQVLSPGQAIVTTVAQPDGNVTTTTTQINTAVTPSHDVIAQDGTRLEIDSDTSVHQVFPDGSRVAAEDGVHALRDGTSITVKDGRQIP